MAEPDFDPVLMKRYQDAAAIAKSHQDRLEADVLRRSGWAKGDIAEDRYSGLRYRIAGCHAYVTMSGGVGVSLEGYRTYKSGRREARSSSHLSSRDLKKVVDTAAPAE